MANKFITFIEHIPADVVKAVKIASTWFPRVVKIADDVQASGPQVLGEAAKVLEDAGVVAEAAVKDGAGSLLALEALIAAIGNAAAVKGLNIASDEAVGVAFETFIKDVTNSATWTDLIDAVKQLAQDASTLDSTAVALLKQLETDAKS